MELKCCRSQCCKPLSVIVWRRCWTAWPEFDKAKHNTYTHAVLQTWNISSQVMMLLLLTPSEHLHCSPECAAAQPWLSVHKNLIRERGGQNRSLLFSPPTNMLQTSWFVTRSAFTPIDVLSQTKAKQQRRAVFESIGYQRGQAHARTHMHAHLIFTYLVLGL